MYEPVPSYKSRLQELGLKTLFYRRVFADVLFAFEIIRGEVCLKPSRYGGRTTTSLQQSFFYRACQIINKLPPNFMMVQISIHLRRLLTKTDVLAC
ncbi:hypothetical protein Y032_0129g1503 [Ancylostoma ceylanicum]|uniref:Uncharacterized protein n=1 Tax=Ancylostoma ceylanicum TaxID=53326 RepID=A0A016T6W0_9BILA|nr:hypothetical protein Y032_0129g1503 [Ancylostoma ceylanicum]